MWDLSKEVKQVRMRPYEVYPIAMWIEKVMGFEGRVVVKSVYARMV